MSATTEEVLRILKNASAPMTASEIYDAGDFSSNVLMNAALHDMSVRINSPQIVRVRPEGAGKFTYRLTERGDVPAGKYVAPMPPARTVRPLDEPRKLLPPIAAPKPPGPVTHIEHAAPKPPAQIVQAANPGPANDGAYAAVIFDLKARREKVQAEAAAEIRKIEVALEGLEALG